MPRSTLFAYISSFSLKSNEINESYQLCQVRGKYTVRGIVFYKHLFLHGVYSLSLFNLVSSRYKQVPVVDLRN